MHRAVATGPVFLKDDRARTRDGSIRPPRRCGALVSEKGRILFELDQLCVQVEATHPPVVEGHSPRRTAERHSTARLDGQLQRAVCKSSWNENQAAQGIAYSCLESLDQFRVRHHLQPGHHSQTSRAHRAMHIAAIARGSRAGRRTRNRADCRSDPSCRVSNGAHNAIRIEGLPCRSRRIGGSECTCDHVADPERPPRVRSLRPWATTGEPHTSFPRGDGRRQLVMISPPSRRYVRRSIQPRREDRRIGQFGNLDAHCRQNSG